MLNTIRNLHDASDIPVLLVGLHRLIKTLSQGRGDDSPGATLFSRIAFCCDLSDIGRSSGDPGRPLHTVNDIRRMFASDRLRIEPAALSWLTRVANMTDDGGLRMVVNLVRMARRVAEKGDGEITRSMLTDAAGFLLGAERARVLKDRIVHSERVA